MKVFLRSAHMPMYTARERPLSQFSQPLSLLCPMRSAAHRVLFPQPIEFLELSVLFVCIKPAADLCQPGRFLACLVSSVDLNIYTRSPEYRRWNKYDTVTMYYPRNLEIYFSLDTTSENHNRRGRSKNERLMSGQKRESSENERGMRGRRSGRGGGTEERAAGGGFDVPSNGRQNCMQRQKMTNQPLITRTPIIEKFWRPQHGHHHQHSTASACQVQRDNPLQ